MAYPIDKGVPIPPSSHGKGRLIYPWDEMEVGDSFVPRGKTGACSLVLSANAQRPGKTFLARRTDGVSRIWRTA